MNVKTAIAIGLISATAILFQNCADTSFSSGGSSSSSEAQGQISQPGFDDAFGTLAQLGLPTTPAAPYMCYGYSDEAMQGPCSANLTKTVVAARLDASGNIVVRVIFPRSFVDNTYGVNAIGWPVKRGHTFKDLVGSDHVVVAFYDKADSKVLETKLDYITLDSASGKYISLGVDGGDGSLLFGNRADVLSVNTSLSMNLNELGYSSLIVDSPVTDANYTPNAQYPNWIYHVWYEVTLRPSAFAAGGGYGRASLSSVHASPSKIGVNTCEVTPVTCE